jgi:hypothetical protein
LFIDCIANKEEGEVGQADTETATKIEAATTYDHMIIQT